MGHIDIYRYEDYSSHIETYRYEKKGPPLCPISRLKRQAPPVHAKTMAQSPHAVPTPLPKNPAAS